MVGPFDIDIVKQLDISIPHTFFGGCKCMPFRALRLVEYDLAGDAAPRAASEDERATVRPS
jgi:hypothetical protein